MAADWRKVLALVLAVLPLAGCGTGPDVSLTVTNAGAAPLIVRVQGPTVPLAGYRIEPDSTVLLLSRQQPPGSDPSATLRVLSSGCEEVGRNVLALTGHVLVSIDTTPIRWRFVPAPPSPTASASPLAAADACPDAH